MFFQPGVQTWWDAVTAHQSPEPLAALAWPPHSSPGTAPDPQPLWQLLGRVTLSRHIPALPLVMTGPFCAGESPRSGTAAHASRGHLPYLQPSTRASVALASLCVFFKLLENTQTKELLPKIKVVTWWWLQVGQVI